MKILKIPRWYQDLSIPQMEMAKSLRNVMQSDQEENLTGRTRKILMDIGIISTFVRIPSKDIKQWQKQCNLDPINFLCEIYRFVTGNYFVEESYKKSYDCNERIILTCIAFLKLPETLIELHQRLPMGKRKEFPPKPLPPKLLPRQSVKSPYLDTSFVRPDWKLYKKELLEWEKLQKFWVQPRAILPLYTIPEHNHTEMEKEDSSFIIESTSYKEINSNDHIDDMKSDILETEKTKNQTVLLKSKSKKKGKNLTKNSERPKKSRKRKKKDVESIKENIENFEIKPVEEILSSHVGAEEYITEINDQDRVTVELNEKTSDDWFFQLIGSDRNNKKTFPPGRHNLSSNWQEWLLNVDEEYSQLEKEADKIIKDVRNTAKKIFNPDACDGCCACRETQKSYQKYKESKIPNIVIDSLTSGETGKKYIVGSMVLNSPPESLSETSMNQPFVIPSEDKIVKKSIINSVTIENGEIKYRMEGITKQIQHIPTKIIKHLPIPNNIPSCNCKKNVFDGVEENGEFVKNTDGRKCRKCADRLSDRKIFVDYEKMCRENDQKNEEIRKKNIREMEYLPFDDGTVVEEEKIEEVEKCKKCVGCAEEKCKPSPFKEFLDQLCEQQKLEAHQKSPKIPGKKEYRDNIKISIGGVMESGNESNHNVLTGISLQTPIELTPEPSEPSLKSVPSMSNHHHWSVTEFVPKNRSIIPSKVKTIENKSVIPVEIESFEEPSKDLQIFDVMPIKSDHIVKTAIKHNEEMRDDKIKGSKDERTDHEGTIKHSKERMNKEQRIIVKKGIKDGNKIKHEDNITKNSTEKNYEKVVDENLRKKANYVEGKMENSDNAIIKLGMKQNMYDLPNEKRILPKKMEDSGKEDLTTMMKAALEEMAEDGNLLAKLPDCHNIPPLQVWIMYRKGFAISEKKNSDRLKKLQKSWEAAENKSSKKLKAPDMKLSDKQAAALTFKTLFKIKRKIEVNKKKFYSNVRKNRVMQSRIMWNLMEQGQYPTVDTKFKDVYFKYQASKESDGFLLKPYGIQSE